MLVGVKVAGTFRLSAARRACFYFVVASPVADAIVGELARGWGLGVRGKGF